MTARLPARAGPGIVRLMSGHDPTSDASRLRAALDVLGWSQRYLAWRLFTPDPTIRKMARGSAAVPPELLAWLESAATPLRLHPLPEGWQNGSDEPPRTGEAPAA